jgi:hypothetical protein
MKLGFKLGLSLVLLVVTGALVWSAYAPQRWLGEIRRLVRAPEMPDRIPAPQPPKERIEGRTPKEVVDEVWRMATQGQLLTPEGWHSAGAFFTKPRPFPANEKILVVSNAWGPAYQTSSDGDSAAVTLDYFDAGTIDPKLCYDPPPKTDFVKTGFGYTLVAVPSYLMMYGSDGKTLVEKRPTGSRVWLIQGAQGPPVTTVNTAIRYVLEMRGKTTDQVTKRNADQTLAQLLKLH